MGALSGVRVVEFEGWIAGSLLGMLLADQGAEVIRIARPGRPIYDRDGAGMLARGKQSIILDLSDEADRGVALRLASTADIVIENLRPGALDALGVGCDILRTFNPRLIHVRLPGFASDDVEHENIAAYEGIIAATIGLFTEINLVKPTFGMDPVYSPLALPSVYGAVQGAIACNAALFARAASGEGVALEVPLAAAAAMAMSSIYMQVEGAPAHYETPNLPKIAKSVILPLLGRYWRKSPERQNRFYAKVQTAVPALMSAYPCSDGRQLYVFAIDHAQMATRLLDILGLLNAAQAFGFITANPYCGPVKAPNLATTASLPANAQSWLRENIAEKLLARPAIEWETLFAEAGLPAALVRTTEEWMEWPPLLDSGALIRTGAQLALGRQCWFPHSKETPFGAAVERDQHGTALRNEAAAIALPSATPPSPRAQSWRPLAGIKVLDFASMVAGPVAGRTLAELGAEVIKVESPNPHHGPRLTCWYGLDVNQGKQSVLINIKTADGRRVAARLIQDADVILHNFTPAAAVQLMLDAASISAINPTALICEIAAYSGPNPSDLDGRHGYDPVLQMASGISARYGSLEKPELHGIASCIDNLTGYSAAFGIVTALAANVRGQSLRSVKTSLVQAANLSQFPYSTGVAGSPASGQDAMGDDDRTRMWRTRDGWIFAAPGDAKQEAAFDEVIGREGFNRINSVEAIARLRAKGVSAVKICRLSSLRRSFAGGRHSIQTASRTIDGLKVTQVTPDYLRVEGRRLPSILPAQKPGTSTARLMQMNGFSDAAIQSFIASGAVATQLSKDFLP